MKVGVPDELLPADRLGRVHFVGIGGAGLSAIARIMLARGIVVSGSDGVDSPTLEALRALGAGCTSATPPTSSGTRTPSSSRPRSARTTPSTPRRSRAACGCCRARRRWPR